MDRQRGHLETEQRNPVSDRLDEYSVTDILRIINGEDATVAGAVAAAVPRIAAFVEELIGRLKRGGRLIYVGAGTSGRLGVLDAAEAPPTFSVSSNLVRGVIAGGQRAIYRTAEGAEDNTEQGAADVRALGLSDRDCLLGIATGSTTPYVLGALAYARQLGAFTGFLIATSERAAAGKADVIIPVVVGPEVITGSTRMKAGTATKLVLNMITTVAMVKLGKTYGNLMVDLKATSEKLWDRGSRIVAELTGLAYGEARGLLERADGEVKTAVVMEREELSAQDARARLAQADGFLRAVLD